METFLMISPATFKVYFELQSYLYISVFLVPTTESITTEEDATTETSKWHRNEYCQNNFPRFKGSFTLSCGKGNIFPSRMGNIGLYEAVHMETCDKGNSKGVVINWVLRPIVTAMATTKFPLPLPQLSVNEP